jgi:hypothetical protein
VGRWFRYLVLGVALGCGPQQSDISGFTGVNGMAGGGAAGSSGTAGAPTKPTDQEVACTKNSDCVLEMTSCLQCSAYELDHVVALNGLYAEDYRGRVCARPPHCPPYTERSVHPALLTTCQALRCVVIDLRQTEITACDTDDDCKLRTARCCDCTEMSREPVIPIGVDQDAAYEALRCDVGAACAECSDGIPVSAEYHPDCSLGHCYVSGFVE